MSELVSFLSIAGASYVFLVVFAWQCADRVIYQPQPSSYLDRDFELKLTASDGTKLSAVHLKSAEKGPTILYFHGNGEDLGDVREHLENMHARGYSVFAFDYRGYGTTPGTPSEANLHSDASTAYAYLMGESGVAPESIIAYGRSLGSGPAVELAANNRVGALVLEGAFTSAYRAVTQIRVLPMDCFDNLSRIRRVTAPVLIIHAVRDAVVPFRHGRMLHEAANEPKMHLWLEDASHASFAIQPGEEYWNALDRFARLLRVEA